MEDDRVAILEAQLSQAKLIAEEADKKYEEVECKIQFYLKNYLTIWIGFDHMQILCMYRTFRDTVRDVLGIFRDIFFCLI